MSVEPQMPLKVVVSIADLESLEETLDVLSRTKLIAQIRDSLDELDRQPAATLSKDDVVSLRG